MRTAAAADAPMRGMLIAPISAHFMPSGVSAVNCPAGRPPLGDLACGRPYSANSPFNRRIGASPRVMHGSDRIIRRIIGFGRPADITTGNVGPGADWGHPVYWSQPSDPVFRVHCTRPWGRCDVEGASVRMPEAARPADSTDAHLTVIDPESGVEHDFWAVESKPSGGGVLRVGWAGVTNIDSDGLESDATAAGFGGAAGAIRAEELRRGRIDHALFMLVHCDAARYVFPADGSGRSCASRGLSNRWAPPMGAHLQLDLTRAQIDRLELPSWKSTILRALAEYGAYVGDTGGAPWSLLAESPRAYATVGLEDPLLAIARDADVPQYDGMYSFPLADGVDWRRHLRVLEPPAVARRC
jgi:hypothetical protein